MRHGLHLIPKIVRGSVAAFLFMLMHTTCLRACSWVGLFAGVLAACANEVGLTDDADSPEVGVTVQPLAGRGDAFWQPARGEINTNVFYCWNSFPQNDATSLVQTALEESWTRIANLSFIDEGLCSEAAHRSEAVQVWPQVASEFTNPQTEHLGTRVRGGWMTLMTEGATSPCALVPAWDRCITMQAVHEFGHVLGFGHESVRTDFEGTRDCPNGNPSGPALYREDDIDTAITGYDPFAVTDTAYCRVPDSAWLSDDDMIGARALYGSSTPDCTNSGRPCVYAQYANSSRPLVEVPFALRYQRPQPAPGEANAQYLKPTNESGVEVQTFVGSWEQLRFVRVNGDADDGFIHYGDTIAVVDRWWRWLSGRDTGDVDMRPELREWESWVVETVNETNFPNGSRVLINAPLRLRSAQWGTRIMVSGTDVRLTTATSVSEWRINGPFKTLCIAANEPGQLRCPE